MGFFNAITQSAGFLAERVGDVAKTATTAVANVAQTATNAVVNVVQTAVDVTAGAVYREVKEVVDKTVDTVDDVVSGVIDYATTTSDSIIGGGINTVRLAVETVTDTVDNVWDIGGDLLQGRVDLSDYNELITDLWQGTGETLDSGWTVGTSTINLVRDLNTFVNEGGSLSLGDINALFGINVIGSLLGGNTDQGTIPDARGITGPVPISVSLTGDGIAFGGEVPITPLVTAVLAAIPVTTTLVPLLAPLNLGGIGFVGTVDKEGFTVKLYGIAGPNYNVGIAKVGTTIELGTYTDVNLLSWNNKTVADLPFIGDILGKIPVIKDIGISLPKLDIYYDSKAYAQFIGGVDVLGKGPQGQVEVITDLDHNVGVLATILAKIAGSAVDGAGKVAGSALDGAGKVVAAALNDQDAAPSVQLIGNDSPVHEQALAA